MFGLKSKKTKIVKYHDSPNNFMKILIACGATIEDLTEREWYIEETDYHCYYCSGYHPTLLRKSLKGTNIFV